MHPGHTRERRGKGAPISVGRTLAIKTKTKNGEPFNIINVCFPTADRTKERRRTQIWTIIQKWISKHPHARTILVGDLNCAPLNQRQGYTVPLGPTLNNADAQLTKFYEETSGQLTAPMGPTWSRGKIRVTLDLAITWNFP